jgi:HAD superfamily hydrolase (TIGR01549 family)
MTWSKPRLFDADAIIFDVDGTLVDSVDLHAKAWQRAFAEFGHNIAFEAIRSQIGKGGDQLMPEFLTPPELERAGQAIEKRGQDIFKRDYMHRVRGFPKVPDLFRFLVSAGKKLALGSSAKKEDLAAYKRVAGIEDIAMLDLSSDDADRSKPHPDIFIAAMKQLGLRAGRVAVVGDSPFDIQAAHKAGMTATALLCGGFSEASLTAAGAAEIYRDPAQLLAALSPRMRLVE